METERGVIRFETPEHHHEVKSLDWHWIVWIVAASIAAASILLGNLTFGILVIVATFTLIITSSRPPSLMDVEISGRGIRVDKTLYPWNELDGFGIDVHSPHYHKLIIRSTKRLVPHIIIPLENADSDEVRAFVSRWLEDADLTEPLGHKILEYLGF